MDDIICTSQQSRYHVDTLDTSQDIDLHGVSIALGQNELIQDSRLKVKEGVRYALIGRNGSGKSTLLKALADKLIPGLSPSMRILLLSQVEDGRRQSSQGDAPSVLRHVLQGDEKRIELLRQETMLQQAVESEDPAKTHRIVSQLKLEKRNEELEAARKVAMRRSGARGKDARQQEIIAEENLKDAKNTLESLKLDASTIAEAASMLADVQLELSLLDADSAEARAATILSGLGFSQSMIDGQYTALSGGWRSRCSLATALLVQSDVLCLDEPSNFLDLEAILWLETYLLDSERTLIITSHDQVFLNNVADETMILRNKKLSYFEGTPEAFEVNEAKELKRKSNAKDVLDKKKEHIEKSIQQGRAAAKSTGDDNRMRMVKSRQKKLDERWGVETSAKGGKFKLNRDMAGYHLTMRDEVTIDQVEPPVKIQIPDPEPLRTRGNLIHFDKVSSQHAKAAKPLLQDVTFTIAEDGRCALLGANGQGKSTLAKLILGEISPTSGTIARHPLMKIGYFSQHSVEDLSNADPKTNALQYFLTHFQKLDIQVLEKDARACLGSFGLAGRLAVDVPLVKLSGGQKVRLALALIVFRPPHLLLLDEVTTHLDTPTIRALGKALQGFTGGIIIITHDRWFSRKVVEGESGKSEEMSDDSSEDDTEPGISYKVGGGKVKQLQGGMSEYIAFVERKIARRQAS